MLIHFISNNIQIVFNGQISMICSSSSVKTLPHGWTGCRESGFHPILLHGIFQYIGIKVKFRRI